MRHNMRRLMLLIVATALLFAGLATLATAQDDDEGDDPAEVERKVEVETDDDGVSMVFKREDGAGEDKVEMEFRVDDATFRTKYETENATEEMELKLSVVFGALAEFRDSDGDGAYDDGETIVSAWSLGEGGETELEGVPDLEELGGDRSIDWGTPEVRDVTADGVTGKTIVVAGTFDGAGAFLLRFHVFGDFVDFQGESLHPTSAKIDIVFRDYPFEEEDTLVALFMETESKAEHEFEDDHDEVEEDEEGVASSASLGDRNMSLVFTWKGNATVDGNDTTVHTTVLAEKTESEAEEGETEEKHEKAFALTYARGTNIVHDPEMFLSSADENGVETETSPAAGPMLVLLGVALLAVAARRRL
ncbi:MAG: hypothetical protein KY455_11890 [Euryarchaeota archaeon]|nr:hypothetical protein [Euryarchaeota archaeon]